MIFVLPILLYPILGLRHHPVDNPAAKAAHGGRGRHGILTQNTSVTESRKATALIPSCSIHRPKPSGWSCSRSRLRAPGETPGRREQAIRDKRASAVMMIPRNLPDQLQHENDIDIPIKYNSVDETEPEHV